MKETTISYYLTNILLRKQIFLNWNDFFVKLKIGPEIMKQELFRLWNVAKDELLKKDNLKILDIDQEVVVNDFDVTLNVTKEGIRVFFFIFPDSKIASAQCKSVALALTENKPRYFTMEYFSIENNQAEFMFGEWDISGKHFNYGKLERPTIECFGKFVNQKLSSTE